MFDKRWESDIYAKRRQINKYPFDTIVSTVYQHFGRVENKSEVQILEIGCGTANNIRFLAEEGYSATGLDASNSAIDFGREFLKDHKLEAELLVQDFSDLSNFENDTFDMVIDRGSMTHNSRAAIIATLSEVHRVLKLGGVFVSQMFSTNHSGKSYGVPNGDGSFSEFTDGFFKGHNFVFYFTSEEDINELFGSLFNIESKIHSFQEEKLNKNDIRAMWNITGRKVHRN